MRLKLLALLSCTLLVIFACRHEIPWPVSGVDNPATSSSCSPDSVYFTNTILPVINAACATTGCHDAASRTEDLTLNNYSGIMQIVNAGNAGGSKLYRVITSTDAGDIMPPPPHTALPGADIAAIQKWINQGARNNQCLAACDTAAFTFSGAVSMIIKTYCRGCHNPASAGGGIDLSTYNGIKAVALSGQLMGSTRHLPGYKAMPQGTNKLQDCQLRQIERWIEAGMPDN